MKKNPDGSYSGIGIPTSNQPFLCTIKKGALIPKRNSCEELKVIAIETAITRSKVRKK